MQPDKTKSHKRDHLPSAIELVIHKLAQGTDILEPQSDEDIVEMLSSQDLANVPKPDPGRFERMIHESQQRDRVNLTRPQAIQPAEEVSGPPPLLASFVEFRRRLQKGKAGYFTAVQLDRLIRGVSLAGVKLQPHDLPVGWRFSRIGESSNSCLPLQDVYECLVLAGRIQSPSSKPKPKGRAPIVKDRTSNLREDFWAFKAERN